MSFKQLTPLQVEMLGVIIKRNEEKNPITLGEFYKTFKDHVEYEVESADMWSELYQPDWSKPNGENQPLLPINDAKEVYDREFNRIKRNIEETANRNQLEQDLLWYQTKNAKDVFDNYPKVKTQANWALGIAIATAVILLLTLIAIWRG